MYIYEALDFARVRTVVCTSAVRAGMKASLRFEGLRLIRLLTFSDGRARRLRLSSSSCTRCCHGLIEGPFLME